MPHKQICLAPLLLALVVLLFASSGCGGSEAGTQPKQQANNAIKVTVIKVEPTVIRDALILPGSTEAIEDVVLGADHGGQIQVVEVAEGDSLAKGQLLAKIDVDALKTALDRAEANYKMAEDQAQRRKKLIGKGVIGQEEYDKIETARVVAANNLREAKVMYQKGFVHSPIKGRVNKLYVDPGEFVDRGKPVAEIVNTEKIKVNVNVPELDVRYIKKGDPSRITLDAYPGEEWYGAVDFVAFKADPATKTFHARVVVGNSDGRIRPGMIARAGFLKQTIENAVAAPLGSLVDKGGERLVFVEKDGKAQARTVELGVVELDRIQITKGLEAGENLIVIGQNDIEDGMKVQVQ